MREKGVKTYFQVAFCSIGAWKWVASTAHVPFPHLSGVESVQKSCSKSDWVDCLIMESHNRGEQMLHWRARVILCTYASSDEVVWLIDLCHLHFMNKFCIFLQLHWVFLCSYIYSMCSLYNSHFVFLNSSMHFHHCPIEAVSQHRFRAFIDYHPVNLDTILIPICIAIFQMCTSLQEMSNIYICIFFFLGGEGGFWVSSFDNIQSSI